MEKTEQKNGEVTNRIAEHIPATVSNQQMQIQQNMQQIIANMQEMSQAMNLAKSAFGCSLDMLEPLAQFAQLEGQRFEMHEVISFTIQD